ncbi:glutamine-rich protein 2 isoform X3 [Acinonyx jubatus]|uniref:Glutamine-rich protein 2 isoform X3 n=1 Tax=Acinonyx jubatus TaxID=32536 RepID=A0ABM3PA39_ACIJB|nr:glutamine-rich protein 2 isoform X3 [Acinonyx jubatus]
MPPATATARVSLRELADLAIGTPEVGAVNFTALHTLIVAMLRSLNLQEVRINFQSPSPESSRSSELPRTVLSAPQLAVPKEKPRSSSARPPALESQVKDLSKQLKTVTSQVQGIMGHVQHLTYPVGRLPVDSQDWLEEEMAVLLPDRARGGSMKIGKDGEQDGERASVTKATVLLHDVAEDVKALKEAKEKAQEHSEKAFQRMDELEKIIRERDKFLDLVGRKLSLMPVGEEVTMVTWEELEQAITDGWRASQAGSETTMGLLKRKKHTSLTSDDGASTKHSSADPTVDSAHGHGSDRTLSGISATGYPSEGVGREQKKSTPTTASPGREQHPRARDEAGVAKSRHPSVSQFRLESDRHRTRELQPHTSAYLRKDEREAHPGLVQQDLPSATAIRDQHPRVYPDQHGGVHVRYGQIYPRPDQHGIAPLGTDQLASLNHSTYPHSVVPLSMGQLGMMPPGMDEQGSVLPGMDQRGMMPPLVPGRDQRGLQLPSTDQPGMVPFSTYQHGMTFPGTDQQPDVAQRGLVPLHVDQHGFLISGMDQQGLALPGMDQHGLVPHLIAQHGLGPTGTDQNALVQPGLVQPGMDQRGLVQPVVDERGLVQPGAYLPDWVRPGAYATGWVQPGAYPLDLVYPDVYPSGLVRLGADQPGLMQPGLGQQDSVQPGMDQYNLGQPGMDQRGLVQLGMDQHGLVQPGTVQPGLVQPGAAQPGLVQPGAAQPGLVQPGVGQPGLVQPGAAQPGLVQPGVGQPGLVQPGAAQPGLVQPGAAQPGLVQPGAAQPGLVQPGAAKPGLVQPGVGQPGLVQPGAAQPGLVQPGAAQPGLVQPGAAQPGLVQPGAGQPGLVQPGAAQPGLVQPGAGQPGLVQPGAAQLGLVQPGVAQPGLVQPGAGQPGLVQPGAGQPSLVQPGMDLGGLVQPGMDQRVLAQPGAAQPGLVPPGAGQPGVVQPGMDQRGSAQPGSAQPGLVQPATSQYGLAQPGARQPGLVQPQMGQPALVQPGAGQPGAGQPGLVQPGMDRRGLVYPGADQGGLVQPGAGQPDLVQPGAGQPGLVQRGVGQRGLVEPGTGPRGVFQPGAYPPGVLQPGAYLPSSVEPGAYPQGLVPPGAYPRGLVQPGALPRGFMQPLTDQRGLRQPGRDQQGSIPSSTELRGFPAFHPESLRFISPHPYQHGVMPPSRGQHGRVSPLLSGQGLAPPGTDQEGLSETYQPGVIHPGTDQGGQIKPGADQHDQSYSIPESRDLTYPGPRGPGFPGADQLQVSVDPQQTYTSDRAGISVRTTPSQEATFAKSTVFLNDLYRASSERVDIQSERHDSLDKLSPSFPIAVETFRLMGELIGLYVELKENMKELDEEKAGQTDLEKLQYLLSLMVKKTIPPDLHEQLKTLKALTKEVRQERAKLDKIQRLLEGEREQEIGKEMKDDQLSTQLGILRVTVADIEKELAELRESQERGKVSMEHSVSEASLYLQDQLDKLRTIIESMLASSSTLLSMSMTPRKILTASAPSQIDPETTCPACSLDLGHQVSMLVQRYEQLQDMVTNLAATRPSKKAKLQSQDEELLGHIQSAILQVQGDCEKLNITTGSLIEDHRQKQKDIDVLYQGLEKLEKEKANREHLEMEIDVKADKSALEAKVSRVQFDATTEQLNHMMQELTSKMSGQERDWQKMLDKLLVEMDSKLDRLELDPVKQLLEDRWKALRQQLKERPPLYQADEAAAMRKQLLAHFHCLSCDRPLETPVTGQIIPVIPMGPGLPGHRSIRPYTVFELEQVRQQSRNLKLGCAPFPRGDLAHTERSVGRLRTMHSKMLMDIEKVQIHFGGSVKASSQMIRELLQAQCLSSPCHRRVPDMADYTYSSAPRRCGGSHTLTYPYRRNRLQHLSQGMYPTEEIQIAMKHDEVDILGLDGHIYKGRIDTRLPGIPSKDTPVSASGMTKHKAKQPRPHTHRQQSVSVSSQLPSRPQSAQMLAGNNSGSFPLAGASFQVAPPLPSSPGASPPCPAGPLSGPGLVAALNSLERRIAWELREGMGGRREKIVLTEFSTHASSFPSAQRQTRLLRGAPLPAECGPPAQPQRDGKPASGCGRAPGCPAGGGSRGAHPGAEVHHCSLSKATNKCLGRSLGQRGFSGLGSGRWGGKGGAPAGQAPPDCPQVRGRGASLGEPGMTCSLGIRPRPPHPTDEAALQGLQEG